MAITITERRVGDVTVLEIKGRIVFHDGAAVLRAQINEVLDQARLKILLDLRDVTYIDSFGVGVIAAKYVSLKRKGGDLRLLRPSERCRRALTISGLLRILQTFDNEADALHSFSAKTHTRA
jgi:anti-anti-sigma factor